MTTRTNPHVFKQGDALDATDTGKSAKVLIAELNLQRQTLKAARLPLEVLDNMPTVAWSVTPDGKCDFINRCYLETTGLSEDHCLARIDPDDLPPFLSGLHPDHRARVARIFWSGIRGQTGWTFEAPFLHADNIYHWHFDRAVPLRDASGKIVRFVGTCTDIEQLRSAQEALEEARMELARVTRATTMGEMAASIAHEINQPLTAIVTNVDTCLYWLSKESGGTDKARAAALRMKNDAQRASDVIGRIRNLLTRQCPERSDVAINDVIQEVVVLVRAELQAREITVTTEFAETSVSVVADRVQLQQVVLNLVMNAAEAMGAVTDRERTLTIRSERAAGERMTVTMQDTGTGLDPSWSDRMFDPFFTTKDGGMGLGLSVCRSIVESHGGRLRASPAQPFGAKFEFELPIHSGKKS